MHASRFLACTAQAAGGLSAGGLKTSNQFYEAALAPRNLTAILKVHERKLYPIVLTMRICHYSKLPDC